MKKRNWLLLLLLFLLAACSGEKTEPVIVKTDAPPASPAPTPALIEKETDGPANDEKELYIEFVLPDERVRISLSSVEILKQYLTAVPDRQAEINQMELTRLDIPEQETLYLLQFSCSAELCSYLLLNQEGQGDSRLLADIASLRTTVLSPDNRSMLFIFDRNNELEVPSVSRTKLLILNLESLEKLEVTSEETAFELDFKWPVISASWKNETSLEITIPDIKQPDKEALTLWNGSEDKPVKTIKVSLPQNEQ